MGRTASSQKRGVALTIPVELKRARDVGVNGGPCFDISSFSVTISWIEREDRDVVSLSTNDEGSESQCLTDCKPD